LHKAGTILIVDDDYHLADSCSQALSRLGHTLEWVPGGREALVLLDHSSYDVILLDLKMPGMDGIEVLKKIKERDPHAVVVIVTGYGTVKNAVEVMKLGAYDFLSKPFDPEDLKSVIQRALDQKRLALENIYLRQELKRKEGISQIFSQSPYMERIKEVIRRVAPTDSTVLITGPTGTGKGLVARTIHELSARSAAPFVAVDCGTLVPTLFESELFGHVKGAFTGAEGHKVGKFEVAHGGTIFFDEICNIHLDVQAKLLKAVEERKVSKVGSNREIHVDVRIVAATNKDLPAEIQAGRFREDLFYRLNVVSIHLPPLAERREDIPLLIEYFLQKRNEVTGGNVHISPEAVELLTNYDWPGNVRELENTIERLAVLCQGEVITPADLYFAGAPIAEGERGEADKLADIERQHILKILKRYKGHRSKAAQALGIDRKTLSTKLKRYGLA
jgi:two-component system response regulator HydG